MEYLMKIRTKTWSNYSNNSQSTTAIGILRRFISSGHPTLHLSSTISTPLGVINALQLHIT